MVGLEPKGWAITNYACNSRPVNYLQSSLRSQLLAVESLISRRMMSPSELEVTIVLKARPRKGSCPSGASALMRGRRILLHHALNSAGVALADPFKTPHDRIHSFAISLYLSSSRMNRLSALPCREYWVCMQDNMKPSVFARGGREKINEGAQPQTFL